MQRNQAVPVKSPRLRFTLAAPAILLAGLLAVPPAHAAKYVFGTKDYLNKIQDLDLKGPKGEVLYLGHKYSHHSFIAPYSLSDGGYILGITGQESYYKLDAGLIEKLQAEGKLPKPLPPYEISFWDYAFGHLLWIILACIAIAIYVSMRGDARKKKAVPFAEAGVAHEQSGDLDRAIAEYSKALEIDPKFADVLCRRASAFHGQGAFDNAIADFSKVISAEPKHAMALLGRGAAFEAKGMTRQAVDDYGRAIKISKAGVAYFARGNANLAAGDMAAAIADFTAAIAKEPQFVAAHQNRAMAYDSSGQTALADADRRKAAELSETHRALREMHITQVQA
jgi:tetratricopeptide (TPR) repeat protein